MKNSIETAAQGVAHAEQRLAEAQERYQAAVDHRSLIHQRIAEAEARRQDIRTQMAAGDLSNKEAGGLLAVVDEDLADLQKLLAEAERRVREAEPVREREAVTLAQRHLGQAKLQAEFDALHQHVGQIETVFVDALRRLADLGEQQGHPRHMGRIYRFDHELQSAILHNQPPARRG
jgi:chromosome segregation ATPase